MRLPDIRTSMLALVLAASPVSLPSGFISPPADKPIVLAMSDVIACNFPNSLPDEAVAANLRVSTSSHAPLWRADIDDLADCLRKKAEAI
jgi:hypothetical protein